MKKTISILLLIIICSIITCTHPAIVTGEAKTLQDLYDDLDKMEAELKAKENDKTLTKEKIETIKNQMIKTSTDIQETEHGIRRLKAEIENLNSDIAKKDAEIKKIINYVQITNGENIYLEYIFGAENLTDFVYRMSISEQISDYNNTLINNMNKDIEAKNKKNIEMDDKLITLEKQEKQLVSEQQQLGSKMNSIDVHIFDINEEIKVARNAIKGYERLGCKRTEILEVCSKIPPDSDFLRPLVYGRISRAYEWRDNPISGKREFHYAIDIAGNPTGTPVYAVAAGRVSSIVRFSTCGGNKVVIQHYVNGKYYASRYLHLNTINVSDNQEVTSNTVIGTVGGGEKYDTCSAGVHLHLDIGKGIYPKDFILFKAPNSVDPTSLINFPNKGTYFTSRYIRYANNW